MLDDLVQGEIKVANEQLDDMVLLRGDGTPTYMLSVVVDDIDMGITHVIRGHDHLTNTFRQIQLYHAIGAALPRFAHIPLIHGTDGAKLSKRHGALSVTEYRELGFLPEAVRNYLLRLGWGHGDEEIIGTEQAIAWFDLAGVGRSPARFDWPSSRASTRTICASGRTRSWSSCWQPHLAGLGLELDDKGRQRLASGMDGLKQRARTLVELAQSAAFYVRPRPLPLDEKARKLLDDGARAAIAMLAKPLAALGDWQEAALENVCRAQAGAIDVGFGKLAQALRAALTGATVSPGMFEIMRVLGRAEVLARIEDASTGRNAASPQSG